MLLQFFYLHHELVQLGLWCVTASVCAVSVADSSLAARK